MASVSPITFLSKWQKFSSKCVFINETKFFCIGVYIFFLFLQILTGLSELTKILFTEWYINNNNCQQEQGTIDLKCRHLFIANNNQSITNANRLIITSAKKAKEQFSSLKVNTVYTVTNVPLCTGTQIMHELCKS